MVANKIILNGKILLDLSGDSATEPNVEIGKIFHKANGKQAVGAGTTAPAVDYYDSSDFLADAGGVE